MKTAKLFIVAIDGSQGPLEVQTGARGLYDKYSARAGVNKEVEVVYMGRGGDVRSGEKFDKLSVGKVQIEKDDVVGMYLVAHCGDLTTAVFDHDLAAALKKLLDGRANGNAYKLDKVCMVVCKAATKQLKMDERLDENEEKTLIQRFASLLIKAGLKPRLAGWNGFVTVHPNGKKRILSSTNLVEGFASEMSKSREKQKMVYVYEEGSGYLRRDYPTWTDK